jgi:alpha/beta superfamily hydrolase
MAEDRREPSALTPQARLIHGEDDEIVALKTIFDWAAPQLHPVLVIPGASHFFHAKLPLLKECVKRTLLA